MNKMKMETSNITTNNIEKIGALFPNCITETRDENGNLKRAVNFDMLRQMLSEDMVEGNEVYEFTWVGKKASIMEANRPIRKTLRPAPEESVNWNTTENLYIEGDNLEVLKLLQENYLGKVKMIYIDPPYNTGHDFLYSDTFSVRTTEYDQASGAIDEETGIRLFKNTDTNGRFHSDWCRMIYSRLLLARNLLKNDGVIFVSIDDNEHSNLKNICNEVFGEENFICCLNWNTKKAAQGMTTEHMIVDNHEYILVYSPKNEFRFHGLTRNEDNGFSNPDNDPRGLWKRQYLQRLGQGLPTRTITNPKTGDVFSFETPYTQEKLNNWVADNRIIFPSNPTKYPARKEFLSEYENLQQLVTTLGLYATKTTTEKLYQLFGGKKIFTNPKPDTLIQFILKQAAFSGDIVLDFFSGSATTAHAVMQLNAERLAETKKEPDLFTENDKLENGGGVVKPYPAVSSSLWCSCRNRAIRNRKPIRRDIKISAKSGKNGFAARERRYSKNTHWLPTISISGSAC